MTWLVKKLNFFEGFLFGILTLTLFTVLWRGWSFGFFEANVNGVLTVGLRATDIVIYLFIVSVLYEFLTEKNAWQAGLYTLAGYLFIDNFFSLNHFYLLYGLSPSFIFNLFTCSDAIFSYVLVAFLMMFHEGIIDGVFPDFEIDYCFHFDVKRLVACFGTSGFVVEALTTDLFTDFQYDFKPLLVSRNFTLAILMLIPLVCYVVSSRHWMTRKRVATK